MSRRTATAPAMTQQAAISQALRVRLSDAAAPAGRRAAAAIAAAARAAPAAVTEVSSSRPRREARSHRAAPGT